MNKRNIENERRFLTEEFPEMKEQIMKASPKAIMVAYDMLDLDSEELKEFEKFLIAKGKKDHISKIYGAE
jgi:hypothetical protein